MRVHVTSLFGLVAIVGCGADVDEQAGQRLEDVQTTLDLPTPANLTRLQLSSTHSIEFVEYPELGLVGAIERLDADRDGLGSGMLGAGKPLNEVYLRAAGERLDQDLLAVLEAAEQDVYAPELDGSELPGIPLPSRAPAPREEFIGKASLAACTEPVSPPGICGTFLAASCHAHQPFDVDVDANASFRARRPWSSARAAHIGG